MSRHPLSFKVGFIIMVAALLAGNGLVAQEIKIKTEGGIPVVYNPKEPVPIKGAPSKLTLKEEWTIGQESEDSNYTFSGLQHVQVDDEGYIYAADWKETLIKVYDTNGKHVRSFGRKGQGPGEIGLPFYLGIFQGNKLVVHDQVNGKFIFIDRQGGCLKEVPMGKYRFITRFKVDSDGYFYAIFRSFDETKIVYEIKKFSPALEPLATFAAHEVMRTPGVVQAFSPALFIQVKKDESPVWLDFVKYELTLMNKEGKPVRRIVKDHDPVKVTKVHEKRLIQETWGDQGIRPGVKFEIPEHFPPTRWFYVDDEDRIYVRTYDYVSKDGDQIDRYDVFDPEGRYIAKFYHPRTETFQAIRKGKLYVRVEDVVYGTDLLRKYSMIWE